MSFHLDRERERESARLRESQRENKRDKLVCKMKYLEGGSTGATEQGGLKAEAAEAVTSDLR